MARQKSIEKYDAILKSTLELVTEKGFHGISMSKIAKAAGVATATIYVYFENTEAIINRLYLDLKVVIVKDVLEGYKPFMTAKEGFDILWRNFYRNVVDNPLEAIFLEQFYNSPYITKISKEEGKRQFMPVLGFFQSAIAKGEIREMPEEMILAQFYAPLMSLAKSVMAGHFEMSDQLLSVAIDNAWRSLKA